MFSHLSKLMGEKNRGYYCSGKGDFQPGFLTHGQKPSGLVAKACAIDFYKNCLDNGIESPHILEVGIGNGAFATGFMRELHGLGRKSKECIGINASYTLADFSSKILACAKNNLKAAGFKCETVIYDASKPPPAELSNQEFDLVICNELLDDLPADMYVFENRKLSEVLYDEGMNVKKSKIHCQVASNAESCLVESLPHGFFIPINKAAKDCLLSLSSLLHRNGYIDVFDYGFYRSRDFAMPMEMWNSFIVREFMGQWTVDANFIYLSLLLNMAGCKTSIEPQIEYVRNVLGQGLSIKEGREGLDYAKTGKSGSAKSGGMVFEDDYFYHMRAWNGKAGKRQEEKNSRR